jgi:hypothetical protein
MSLGRRCRESRPVPWWRSGQGNVWEGVRSGNGGVYLKSGDFDEHGVFDPLLPNAQSDDENAPPNPVGLGVGLTAFQRQTAVPVEMLNRTHSFAHFTHNSRPTTPPPLAPPSRPPTPPRPLPPPPPPRRPLAAPVVDPNIETLKIELRATENENAQLRKRLDRQRGLIKAFCQFTLTEPME